MKMLERLIKQSPEEAEEYRMKYYPDGDYPNWLNLAAAAVVTITGFLMAFSYAGACGKMHF